MRKRRQRIDWSKQPLGQMYDHELAEQLGCNYTTVQHQRQLRGIPSYRSEYGKHGINWSEQPLGKVGDKELSRRLGVAYKVVWNQRTKRGIPPKYSKHARPIYVSLDEATVLAHVMNCATRKTPVPDTILRRREFAEAYREIIQACDQMQRKNVRTTAPKNNSNVRELKRAARPPVQPEPTLARSAL